MSGHNPEVKEDFVSFLSDAREIEDYMLSHYGKNVYTVYRMSMGGVLTATLWQNNKFNPEIMISELDKILK